MCHEPPRKVVYVIGQLVVGGSEGFVSSVVRRIDRARFEPYVICLSSEDARAQEIRETGCPVHLIPARRFRKVQVLSRLYWRLRSIKPDIVHTIGRSWYYAIPAAHLAGVPYVIAAGRSIPRWKRTYHLWLDRVLLRLVDVGLFNALAVQREAWTRLGLSAERSRVIYSALDVAAFDRESAEGFVAQPPDGLEQAHASVVVCAVANANADKSLDILIWAHRRVVERMPGSQLWIVGEGELLPELEALVRRLGLERSVYFWGTRRDIPAILSKATLGALSSRSEGAPNAVLEYMAAGLPVVATSVGGLPELVVQNKTGVLVQAHDPAALAGAILNLLDKPKLMRQMGAAGRRRVETCFTMEQMVSETEAIYADLVPNQEGNSA
jgi:glycosyltransferase involved in cell wall biosynthesis